MEELRLYSFGNMYLGGIQAGIQCQHATAELFTKYLPFEHKCSDMLYNWVNKYKTTILLNGGMKKDLEGLKSFLSANSNPKGENKLPWSYFNESSEALGGCITNVCIIVPERIYNVDNCVASLDCYYEYLDNTYKVHGDFSTRLSDFEFDLAKRIKSCRLMN